MLKDEVANSFDGSAVPSIAIRPTDQYVRYDVALGVDMLNSVGKLLEEIAQRIVVATL